VLDLATARVSEHMNLQLFAAADTGGAPGAPPAAGDPSVGTPPVGATPPATPTYTPEQIESWKGIAEDYNTQVTRLEQQRQEMEQLQAQLAAAAQLDAELRSSPQLRDAVQRAFLELTGQAAPGAPQPGAQQPPIPPELAGFLGAQAQQLQGLGQTVQTMQEQQRHAGIEAQAQQLATRYPFANVEEVVNLLMDYPNASLDAAMNASNAHWQQRFQEIQQRQEQQRQQNRQNSTLGPSGMPVANVDKSALGSVQGRRDTLHRLAQIMAASRQEG